ncbi:MAG TPA: DUF5615 family PIN-like protein [Cytophagaceae bacterium]|jgi:hypothetical protein|nr:DUF5615 family PIN-like protein [Cytophagaceae bacterium]
MKLLFDQNLSYRLVRKLSAIFPEAKQVRDLGLENQIELFQKRMIKTIRELIEGNYRYFTDFRKIKLPSLEFTTPQEK